MLTYMHILCHWVNEQFGKQYLDPGASGKLKNNKNYWGKIRRRSGHFEVEACRTVAKAEILKHFFLFSGYLARGHKVM